MQSLHEIRNGAGDTLAVVYLRVNACGLGGRKRVLESEFSAIAGDTVRHRCLLPATLDDLSSVSALASWALAHTAGDALTPPGEVETVACVQELVLRGNDTRFVEISLGDVIPFFEPMGKLHALVVCFGGAPFSIAREENGRWKVNETSEYLTAAVLSARGGLEKAPETESECVR